MRPVTWMHDKSPAPLDDPAKSSVKTDERGSRSTPGHARDRSSRHATPLCAGLGRDDRRPGRLLVLPTVAWDTRLQLRTVGRPALDVEDRLAALLAGARVGAVHASEVPGLLRLDRHAAQAVPRRPADRRQCPDSHGVRLHPQLQSPVCTGIALARAATPACGHPLGDPVLDRACGFLLPVPRRAARFLGDHLPTDGLRG